MADGDEKKIVAHYNRETSRNWSESVAINRQFLTYSQNFLNYMLRSRGHVLVNDVFEQLGMRRTVQGVTTGWVRSSNRPIELLFENLDQSEAEGGVLLILETDGMIYRKIEEEYQ